MDKYEATVIKTGDYYALRVPKSYVEDGCLKLGQKVLIQLPEPNIKQDRGKIQKIISQLRKTDIYGDIQDPVAWQKRIRQERKLPKRN